MKPERRSPPDKGELEGVCFWLLGLKSKPLPASPYQGRSLTVGYPKIIIGTPLARRFGAHFGRYVVTVGNV
jgi:hypothetical protein